MAEIATETLVAELPEEAGEFLGLTSQYGFIVLECENRSYRLDPETGVLLDFQPLPTHPVLQ